MSDLMLSLFTVILAANALGWFLVWMLCNKRDEFEQLWIEQIERCNNKINIIHQLTNELNTYRNHEEPTQKYWMDVYP